MATGTDPLVKARSGMKAVGIYRHLPIDDPESLLNLELPVPVATGRDLLVKVAAIAVNPVDTKVRTGTGKPAEPAPRILGWDAAGVVEAAGPDCSLFRAGDAVYYAGSIIRQGANSEYHLVDERIVGHKPRRLSFAEAAALPLTSITAWEGLFDRMHVSPKGEDEGRSVLILGGAGGVGSIGIQIAKRVARLKVIATASRPESREWCMKLGADAVVDHFGDLPAQLREIGEPLVNYILCCNDTDRYFATMAEVLAPQGAVCTIVRTRRPHDLAPLMDKSGIVAWEFMFTRPRYGTPDMIAQHQLLETVAELVDAGTLTTTVGKSLGRINAKNLRTAHQMLEEGRTIGKLVLEGF
jgi:NADPH:quinone reductase